MPNSELASVVERIFSPTPLHHRHHFLDRIAYAHVGILSRQGCGHQDRHQERQERKQRWHRRRVQKKKKTKNPPSFYGGLCLWWVGVSKPEDSLSDVAVTTRDLAEAMTVNKRRPFTSEVQRADFWR